MATLYLTEQYAKVHRDTEDCLRVEVPERKNAGAVLAPARTEFIPLAKIDCLVILGEVTLTASAVHLLLEREVEISYLTRYGKFKGRLSPPLAKTSLLRLAQHRAHAAMNIRTALAIQFAGGKLANQRAMVMRYNRRNDSPLLSEIAGRMSDQLKKLERLSPQPPAPRLLPSGENSVAGSALATALGLEGAGSAAYFEGFRELIKEKATWQFNRRISHPSTDPVNALLSFGYALLLTHVEAAVQITGFDPYIGYLHSSVHGRPALALDLMEEFRPVLVDTLVLKLLNTHLFKPEDFVYEQEGCFLQPGPRKLFLLKFAERANQEIIHPLSENRTTYLRAIEWQSRFLARYLQGEVEDYVPFKYR